MSDEKRKRNRAKKPGTVIKIRVSEQALRYIELVQQQRQVGNRGDAAGLVVEYAASHKLLLNNNPA